MTDFDETPGAGQQDAPLGVRLFDEIAVTAATFGDRRVVSGDAQPAAQAGQHLVAEKSQFVRHAPGLQYLDSWSPSVGTHILTKESTSARLGGSLEDARNAKDRPIRPRRQDRRLVPAAGGDVADRARGAVAQEGRRGGCR